MRAARIFARASRWGIARLVRPRGARACAAVGTAWSGTTRNVSKKGGAGRGRKGAWRSSWAARKGEDEKTWMRLAPSRAFALTFTLLCLYVSIWYLGR
jgi:hypothetical protein